MAKFIPVHRDRYSQPEWVKFRFMAGHFGIAVLSMLEPALLLDGGEMRLEDHDLMAYRIGIHPDDFEAVLADAVDCGILDIDLDGTISSPVAKASLRRHAEIVARSKGLGVDVGGDE